MWRRWSTEGWESALKFVKAGLDSCQQDEARMRCSSNLKNNETARTTPDASSYMPRKLTIGYQGRDMAMHEGPQHTRKVC